MSVNLSLTVHGKVTIDGRNHEFGSLTTPQTVALGDEIKDSDDISVANGASALLWDASRNVTDFDFLVVISDKIITLELQVDKDADVGTVTQTVTVAANIPFILAADDAYASDYVAVVPTSAPAAGTADVIDKISVYNNSGDTAKVYYFLGS